MVLSAWRRVSGRFVGGGSILVSSLDRFGWTGLPARICRSVYKLEFVGAEQRARVLIPCRDWLAIHGVTRLLRGCAQKLQAQRQLICGRLALKQVLVSLVDARFIG